MQELVVLVDDSNNQIGVLPKLEAHNSHTPLHRGFSCYVFNKNGQFMLTQRALSKKVFPGIWTNSCCGHPAPAEEISHAVKRRLEFELGLEPKKLRLVLPKFRYQAEMNGILENEICPVYIAQVLTEPVINPDEVEDYKWIDWKSFINEIAQNPQEYSKWCVEQVEQLRYMKIVNDYATKC